MLGWPGVGLWCRAWLWLRVVPRVLDLRLPLIEMQKHMNREYSRNLLRLVVFLCSTVRLLSLASNSSNLIAIVSRLLVCHWSVRVHVTLLLQVLERL